MAALYADENFPLPVVTALRAAGFDVLTVREDARADQKIPDPEVLARAAELGRALLTHIRSDFIRLHRAFSTHAGIIVCTEDLNFTALAERIQVAISDGPILCGHLLRVNRPNQTAEEPT